MLQTSRPKSLVMRAEKAVISAPAMEGGSRAEHSMAGVVRALVVLTIDPRSSVLSKLGTMLSTATR